jgi:acyl-CoA synthetase (AMP-forming)/AMP-acid ligase II
MRIIDMFDRSASFYPSRDCLIEVATGVRYTYGEALDASHKIGAGLLDLGVEAGETKIAVYSPNAAVTALAILGIHRAGGVYIPVNPLSSSADNVYVINTFGAEILMYHSDYEENVSEIRKQCPNIRAVVVVNGEAPADTVALDSWLASPARKVPEIPEDRNAITTIFSTGGTTGRPKGAMHTHAVWEGIAFNMNLILPAKKPPVHLIAAPLTHAAGAMMLSLFLPGATQVILRKFSATAVLDAIEKYRATHLFLPPTALYATLAEERVSERDYSSLEYLIYGAAPSSTEKVAEAIRVFGPVLAQGYGQVEAGPAFGTILTPQDHMDAIANGGGRLASCGRRTPLAKLKIVNDDTGEELGPNERGMIAFGGEFQMREYYQDPEQTAQVRHDGWIWTGDIGYMDEEGYVFIVDRKKEMIISGGFNIFPGEVEQAIFNHPAVQDCAVVGVPDEKWGEAVKAVVQLKAGQSVTESEIIEVCKGRLGSVMAPKSVDFWDELPRSPVGKVLRRSVRDTYWEGRTRAIV